MYFSDADHPICTERNSCMPDRYSMGIKGGINHPVNPNYNRKYDLVAQTIWMFSPCPAGRILNWLRWQLAFQLHLCIKVVISRMGLMWKHILYKPAGTGCMAGLKTEGTVSTEGEKNTIKKCFTRSYFIFNVEYSEFLKQRTQDVCSLLRIIPLVHFQII